VLLQFNEFLGSSMTSSAFEALLPSFGSLVKNFAIEPSVALHLWRPVLSKKVRRSQVPSPADDGEQLVKEVVGTVGSSSENGSELGTGMNFATEGTPSASEPQASEMYGDLPSPTLELFPLAVENANLPRPWQPTLVAFIDEANHVLPSNVWRYMRLWC
jgi:hypothetical protein